MNQSYRENAQKLWDSLVINPQHEIAITNLAATIAENFDRYKDVAKETKIPATIIGVLHMRESTFDFNTHLANGDPLSGDTYHVPAGIMAPLPPPYSWEEAAIVALKKHCDDWNIDIENYVWDVPGVLWFCEAYNGFGYEQYGVPSPYLWSGTNHYTKGYFGSDGVYDPDLVNAQMGCAPVLKLLNFFA